jgi:hypothetical protein
MTHPIFNEGDKAVLNNKAPKWILRELNNPYEPRTIVQRWYCKAGGYMLYFLGHNQRGLDLRKCGFRAYMLDIYVPLRKDRTYKRAQALQSKLQKSMRDSIASTGKANSRPPSGYIRGTGRRGNNGNRKQR